MSTENGCVRLALVGCGKMSATHTDRFNRLGNNVRIVAAVDPLVERARETAKLFAGAQAADDVGAIIHDADAFMLNLPHDQHHPVAMTCMRAGKHVLMEKPLAITEKQCLELIRTADETGVVFMIGYIMVYQPLVVKLKQLLDKKAYGELFHMSIWTEQMTRPRTEWGSTLSRCGGGQLFGHGCHYVDLLLWMMGRPECGSHVGTNLGTPWMKSRMEGTSNLCMRFENGATAYHFGTWGARGTRLRYSIHAHCTGGMLEVDFASGELRLIRDPKAIKVAESPRPLTIEESRHDQADSSLTEKTEVLLKLDDSPGGRSVIKASEKQVDHFVDCILNGRRPHTDARRSLQSLRVIWKLYEAERKGLVADLRGISFDNVDVSRELCTPIPGVE